MPGFLTAVLILFLLRLNSYWAQKTKLGLIPELAVVLAV